MKESTIEKAVCNHAKANGWLPIKLIGTIGMPDRIMFKNGNVLLIEFKNETGRLSKMQKLRIKQLEDREFKVHVVNDIALGKELIDGIN